MVDESTTIGTGAAAGVAPPPADAGASEGPAADAAQKVVQMTETDLKALVANTVNEAVGKARQQERTAMGRKAAEERRRYQEQGIAQREARLAERMADLPDDVREDVGVIIQSRQQDQATAAFAQWQADVLKDAGLTTEDYEIDPTASPPEWSRGLVKAQKKAAETTLQSLVAQEVQKALGETEQRLREDAGLETVDTGRPGIVGGRRLTRSTLDRLTPQQFADLHLTTDELTQAMNRK